MAPARAATLRRPLPVVLLVLVLAVAIAVIVFGVGRHGGPPATADRPGGYQRTGPSSVAYVLTDARRPRVLTVYGEVDDACPGAPRPTVRGVIATQTPSVVTVRLDRWSAPAAACAGVGLGPQPTTLRLTADLGHRMVREQLSGRAVPTLDLATVAVPHQTPVGYAAQAWQWQPGAGGGLGALTRTYTTAGDRSVRFVTWDVAPDGIGDGTRIVESADVNGRPAVVRQGSELQVVWTPSRGRTAMVQGDSATVAELLRLARSVG